MKGMWTVRCIDNNTGEWRWYLHQDTGGRTASNSTFPNGGWSCLYPDQGTATLMCDAFNVRDFGEIDPAPYKGYWKEI